jgi:hypothetical protein
MEIGEGELMITLDHDRLTFCFPELYAEAKVEVSFERTLRIPDDGRDYPLPPGFGRFALRHVDDYIPRLPERLTERGGVILPMYQAEAMWLNFRQRYGFTYPIAIKIGTGKINAVTGSAWSNELSGDRQDYVVVPGQPWLDGYCIETGVVRQFVAAPLDRGITVEEQLTHESTWGGLQLLAFPMKIERALELRAAWEEEQACGCVLRESSPDWRRRDLGLAAGGCLRQAIYDDPFGVNAWDQDHSSRCFVTILASGAWTAITGEAMPTEPLDAADYTEAGLPWFTYETDRPAIAGSELLNSVKSIAKAWTNPEAASAFQHPIGTPAVKSLGVRKVREMGG